jgi:hypothetical protein
VTVVPTATAIATSTPVPATPLVAPIATEPTGGAGAGVVAPNTGAGQARSGPPIPSATVLVALGLVLATAGAVLRAGRGIES